MSYDRVVNIIARNKVMCLRSEINIRIDQYTTEWGKTNNTVELQCI